MTEFLKLIESWRRREAIEDVVVEVPEAGRGRCGSACAVQHEGSYGSWRISG